MSGPKGGRYSVEENRRREEQRRQALLAELRSARERLEAARTRASTHRAAGAQTSDELVTVSVDATDAASIASAIRQLLAQADRVDRATTSAVARLERDRALASLAGGVADLDATAAAGVNAGVGAQSAAMQESVRAEIDEILGNLDADASNEQPELLVFAQRTLGARPDEVRTVLHALRGRVDRLNRVAADRRKIVAEARELLLSLVGVAGSRAAELRRRLGQVVEENAELGDLLRREIEEVIGEHRAASDRAYVAEMLHESLAALGYEVAAGFATDLARSGSAYLHRPGWSDHALEVQLPHAGDAVVFSAVREGDPSGEPTAAEAVRDREIEEEFCSTVDPLLSDLGERGIDVGPLRRHAAGEHPMRVVLPARTGRPVSAARRRTAPAEREVDP